MKKLNFVLQLIIAVIFLQTLYLKFTGHEQVVHIFNTLGLTAFDMYFIAILELFTSILLFIPKTKIMALLSSLGMMGVAVFFHLSTPLGIVVEWNSQTDGGKLFGMGVLVIILSMFMLIEHYNKNKPINTIKKIIGL